MPALPLGLVLFSTLLVVAGCGSSSQTYPTLASQTTPGATAGWESFSGSQFDVGSTLATVSGMAVNPVQLKLEVSASPDVGTDTSYQVHCDQRSTLGQKLRGSTPLTREIAIPRGAKSSSANDVECFVTATATKPSDATMTLTLYERLSATTAAHP